MPIWGSASRWGLGMVVLAALSIAGLATANGAAAAEGEPAFCERQTLHDYLTPLQRMPKLRERPYRSMAEPLFRGVRIGASGPSLAVGAGSAGYQFQWDRNPKWDITVNLAQVNAKGVVVLRIAERHVRTAALRPAEVVEPHFGLRPHRGLPRRRSERLAHGRSRYLPRPPPRATAATSAACGRRRCGRVSASCAPNAAAASGFVARRLTERPFPILVRCPRTSARVVTDWPP